MAYEHVNGTYGECLEDRKVFDSKEILRIASTNWDGTAPQLTTEGVEPGHLRRI